MKLGSLVNPVAPFASLWHRRDLLQQMTERDTRSRYRGSAVGLFWSAINPLLMLAIYTFFFSEVFQARWPGAPENRADFALALYIGLLLHGFFAECIVRAPSVVVGNTNLVKKVVFPLEVLPAVNMFSAAFHLVIGLLIWLAFHVFFRGLPPMTVLLLPFIILPLAIMALGFSWMLASLGVYVRDVTHVVPMVATLLLFASPVFYPAHALPEPFRTVLHASPLTVPIEQARVVLLDGGMLNFGSLAAYTIVALAVAILGYAWFQGTRKGFADVL
ncbi:MAG TPA: ABC transporter permease [Casimicrobiaceae bacterium]|nr:ABC transporter permease [Casimicrobiaceae bacterium]